MKPHIRLIAFIVACLVFAPPRLVAQAPPTPTLNDDLGLTWFESYHGGDIDSVNLSNGSSTIRIPVIAYSQRGGQLGLRFSITLNGKSMQVLKICDPLTGCSTQWRPSGVPTAIYDQHITVLNTPVKSPTNQIAWYASLRFADGSTHYMGQTGGAFLGPTFTNKQYETTDGTSYRLIVDGSGNQTIISPSGVLTNPSPGSNIVQEDLNGNVITSNASGLVDTMGRQIPTGDVASDTTGCPQGGTLLPVASATTWTGPGYGTSSFQIKFCSVNLTVHIPDGAGADFGGTWQRPTVQSIVFLGNNTAWTFEYSDRNNGDPTSVNYGSITKIRFPTGGSISYTYVTASQYVGTVTHDLGSRWVASRAVDANDGTGAHVWTYNYTASAPIKTTVTDPLTNDTVHSFAGNLTQHSLLETKVQYYQGPQASNILLKTIDIQYSDVLPISSQTTWPSGKVSKTTTAYDPGFTYFDNLGNHTTPYGGVIASTDYDYGSGAPGSVLRQTNTTYSWQSGANAATYLSENILRLPLSVIVTDGTNTCAETDYAYDDSARLFGSNITTQHQAAPGTLRGNLSSTTRKVSTTPCQANATWTSLTSYTNMYDTHEVYQTIDPRSDTTTYAYSSTYAGALATTVTNALSQATTYAYDFNTGLMTSASDPNHLATGYGYDSLLRLSSVTHADGGQDTVTRQETTFPFSATRTTQINSSQSKVETNVFDGVARTTQHQLRSDPQGTVYTDTTYDQLGRIHTVSNPYRSGTDATSSPGTTTYGYDAIGRKITETSPDNSILQTAYCGPTTLVTDPTNKWRRSTVDGLGRLVEVDEPNSASATVSPTGCPGTGEPIWVTSYTNDPLGNLTKIVQNGSHQRTFTYDSLSRLLTASNPETGTVTYNYDSDASCASPNSFAGLLISKVDARSIRRCMQYDALNRETSLSYSNGDPSITTNYDESSCLSLSSCQNIGHRTSMADAAGSESWAYQVDATNLRSVHREKRTTNSSPSNITKTATYYLNLAGNITQLVYPTGRIVNYTYDSADRPSTAADSANGITYATDWKTPPTNTNCVASAVCYTPQGSVYGLSIGQTSSFTGFNFSETYNNRLQPSELKASSSVGNAIDITYNFVDPASHGNAGHVYSITNNLTSGRSQTFTYDQVNRITSASTTATTGSTCWGYQYSYDAWGNLNAQAGSSGYSGCSEYTSAATADSNNHLAGLSYDLSGNTLSDGNYSYAWNAESQMKTAAGVTYAYDGDGRRAAKVGSTLHWYGSGGEILAETDTSGNTQNEYIFFGGKRVALVPASGSVLYYAEDMLGSSRVVVQSNGTLCYDADFTPYGAERPYTSTCAQNYKFEGKERDPETQNDDFGARKYTWRFGRWLSSDWSAMPVAVPYANLTNPQTLNLYAMVADDPESFADLDGHGAIEGSCYANGTSCETKGPGMDQTQEPHSNSPTAQKMKINIIFSSNLSDKQRARAMGLLGHVEYNLGRLGIRTKETKSQTIDGDQLFSGKGSDKSAFNVVFGTNEDFSGRGSRSGKGVSLINVAKQGDDETILQFEMVQALTTTHSKLPVVGELENAVKDFYYTPFLNAALDGTSRQMKAANVLTFGGFSEMKANAEQYSEPDQ